MEKYITEALTRTGSNILKTGAALVVTTIASNKLREQTNKAISSATESYQRIKEEFATKKL